MGIPTYTVSDEKISKDGNSCETVCAMGPCTTKQVNFVTGSLKLL